MQIRLVLISSVSAFLLASSSHIINCDHVLASTNQRISNSQSPNLAATIRALRQGLKHRDWRVRQKSATSLGELGSKAKDAIPDLAIALRDNKFEVILAAVIALGNMGEDATPAVPALIRQLTNPTYSDAPLPTQVELALSKIGEPAVPALIQVLVSDRDIDDYRTISTLRRIGKPAVPMLISALQSPQWKVRSRAVKALRMGEPAREATPYLLDRLTNKQSGEQDNRVRREIIVTLAANRFESKTVIAVLVQLIPDPDAIETLGYFGQEAKSAVSPLAAVLRDRSEENSNSRAAVVEALQGIGQASSSVMPDLEYALTDPKYFVRLRAARVIVKFGTKPDFDLAVKTAVDSLQSKDRTERYSAIETLDNIGGTSIQLSVPALVRFIQSNRELGGPLIKATAALIQIAQYIKNNQATVSKQDVQTTVQGLEIAQQILQQEQHKLVQLAKQRLDDFDRRMLSLAEGIIDLHLQEVRQAIQALQAI